MTPPIIYDGLRLYLGAAAATPRGVDRVELAYARYFLERWPADCLAALPTPWGIRLYDRDVSAQLLAFVQGKWRETQSEGGDPALVYCRARLLADSSEIQNAAAHRRRGMLTGVFQAMRACGLHLGTSAVRTAPRDAIYVNIGQLCWAVPNTTRWLRHRPDVRAVFMLHDVIPLERPEFVSNGARLAMDWMLRTVIRRATALITTTEAANFAIMAMLRHQGLPQIPACPLHLPVDSVFLQPEPRDDALLRRRYFLVCGAIEPRKNTTLLLDVWERLVIRMGIAAPRLVIAGTAEKNGQNILQRLHQSPALRDHVIVVSGLASPSLRQIMANARALLMPSFAEGFGLPVVEALAVGTPVVASDILAHREIGGEFAVYRDPMDTEGWLETICRLTSDPTYHSDLRHRLTFYRPLTETSYFDQLRGFLETIA